MFSVYYYRHWRVTSCVYRLIRYLHQKTPLVLWYASNYPRVPVLNPCGSVTLKQLKWMKLTATTKYWNVV